MKKVISILSALVMLSSMTAVSVNAIEATPEMLIIDQQIAQIMASADMFYYPAYDSYDTYNLAPTEHYLAAIPTNPTSLPTSFGVYFYLNTNIAGTNPTATSHFTICGEYASFTNLGTVSSSTYTSSCKRILARFTKSGNPSGVAPLFTYSLTGFESNDAVNCEYDIHCYTSSNSNYPSTHLTTNTTGGSLEKCIYALGDVDRDGDLDADDSTAVLSYVVRMTAVSPGRESYADLDRIAFELAGDFNQDGDVDILDVTAINNALNS